MTKKTYTNLSGWEAPQGNAGLPSEPLVRSSELVLQRRRLAFYEAKLNAIAYHKGQDVEECKSVAAATLLTPDDELPPQENAAGELRLPDSDASKEIK